MAKNEKRSDLVAAAEALDHELARFDELAVAARRVPLNSQKNLDRAAKATRDAAENQENVAVHLQALVAAITAARDRHQATATSITARADEIRERAEIFGRLLQRFGELGQAATAINVSVQEIGACGPEASKERVEEVSRLLKDIHERMGAVVEGATELAREADAAGAQDLARQGDAMRQQVHSARNKVELLRQNLGSRAAR